MYSPQDSQNFASLTDCAACLKAKNTKTIAATGSIRRKLSKKEKFKYACPVAP